MMKNATDTLRTSQDALDYIIYMMISGSFAESRMKSPFLERKLLLGYREIKEKDRDRLEDITAYLTDKVMGNIFPEDIWNDKVNTYLIRNRKTGHVEVVCCSRRFILQMSGRYAGGGKQDFTFRLTPLGRRDEEPKVYRYSTYRRDEVWTKLPSAAKIAELAEEPIGA